MTPTAVYSTSDVSLASLAKKPALVIGSLATAQDGKYQSLITDLESTTKVDRQLLDRLIDEATVLEPSSYSSIHVTLSETDYEGLKPKLASFLSQILSGLIPLGTLHLLALSSGLHMLLPNSLTSAGFVVISSTTDSETIIAQKPAAPSVLPNGAVFLRKLNRRKTEDSEKKKADLWTITSSSPSTPLIDAESLLTEEDKQRPVPTCEPINPNAPPRRKKACKGCTCGLAEVEEEERRNAKVVLVDASQNGDGVAVVVEKSEKERILSAARAAPKATSSCGSCFLGDAFRCASCPYLGLPAFKPGEKVEIDFGMDDI